MARIIDNIKRVHNGFADNAKQGKLLVTLKKHAIEATVGGIASPAARTYMSMFADSEDQLNLLTNPKDVPSMPWLHETQAYLIANAMCAPITNGQTGNGIFSKEGETGLAAADSNPPAATAASVLALRPADFKTLFP